MLGQRRALGVRIDSKKNINNALVEKQKNEKQPTVKAIVKQPTLKPIVKQPVEEKKPELKVVSTVRKKTYGGRQSMLSDEIIEQIEQYMHMLEKARRLDTDFLNGAKIDGRMRGILLDWILQIQSKFKLTAETFYLACFIMDRIIKPLNVSKQNVQLVGLSCILVASKFEEVQIPNVHDFVYMGGDCCSVKNLFEAEREVLKALKFQLTFTYPNHFLRKFRLYMSAVDRTEIYELSKFLVDICIVDYSTAAWLPSEAAIASVHSAYMILQRQCPNEMAESVGISTIVAIEKATFLKSRVPHHANQSGKLKGLRLKYNNLLALKLVDVYISSLN